MSEDNSNKDKCPYCGKTLKHPYWAHIQQQHPEEYKKRQTWIKLYQDYSSMGMNEQKSLIIIAELFNVSVDEVKFYLEKNEAL